MGFGGGDSTAVCNVLAWQLVVSQLSSAQATPLSHMTCLRSSLYSLSARVLPAKREKAERMKARGEQTVLRKGRRVSAHGWPIAAELVVDNAIKSVRGQCSTSQVSSAVCVRHRAI